VNYSALKNTGSSFLVYAVKGLEGRIEVKIFAFSSGVISVENVAGVEGKFFYFNPFDNDMLVHKLACFQKRYLYNF